MISHLLSVVLGNFKIPLFVFFSILGYLVFNSAKLEYMALIIIFGGIFVGSLELIKDTIDSIKMRKFVLDYVAILAITVSLLSGEYLVGAIIVLMLSGGQELEQFGIKRAKQSLTKLIDRIPNEVLLWKGDKAGDLIEIEKAEVGQEILVRKGEVIPLDGVLISENAITDESSLTGEPYMMDKVKGDSLRSGTVNSGNALVLSVTHKDEESTYRKIVEMVKEAQSEKAPLVRLADRYSTLFTFLTFTIAGFAYLVSGDTDRILAVLVIATPCPLILATPIALMGGINAAAKRRIIVKKLSSLEVMARVTTVLFDKTGTITLGKPVLNKIQIDDESFTEEQILGIAASIERNSLHPIAKAFIVGAKMRNAPLYAATNISETVAVGISGIVEGTSYTISRFKSGMGMVIQLMKESRVIAHFYFEDKVKSDSRKILHRLIQQGVGVFIFTGDKREPALKIAQEIGLKNEQVFAECTPEDKKKGIEKFKTEGQITAMVGDGINDAPALAMADVGMVFSNEEQTAASQAADVVFLGGDFDMVLRAFAIAKKTILIAKQSILWGIGLSVVGMVLAAFGFVPPVWGAILQECIDVAVIFNALRASR
jgi:heavy metal translocating P-type ATPase